MFAYNAVFVGFFPPRSAVVDRTTFYSPDVTMEMSRDADAAVVVGASAAAAEGVAGVKMKDVFKEPSRPRPSSLGDVELKVIISQLFIAWFLMTLLFFEGEYD